MEFVLVVSRCQRGHDKTPQNTFGRNQCKPCHKKAVANYEKTPACRQYRKSWAATPARKKYGAEYYAAHKTEWRNGHFRRKYGLSIEQYEEMKVKQDYKCAICGIAENETVKGLVVDHDHTSGQVRGLLCNVCNSHVVHVVEDYSDRLEKTKAYLGGF